MLGALRAKKERTGWEGPADPLALAGYVRFNLPIGGWGARKPIGS